MPAILRLSLSAEILLQLLCNRSIKFFKYLFSRQSVDSLHPGGDLKISTRLSNLLFSELRLMVSIFLRYIQIIIEYAFGFSTEILENRFIFGNMSADSSDSRFQLLGFTLPLNFLPYAAQEGRGMRCETRSTNIPFAIKGADLFSTALNPYHPVHGSSA